MSSGRLGRRFADEPVQAVQHRRPTRRRRRRARPRFDARKRGAASPPAPPAALAVAARASSRPAARRRAGARRRSRTPVRARRRARSAPHARSGRRRVAWASKAVLPIPASPSSATTDPRPSTVAAMRRASCSITPFALEQPASRDQAAARHRPILLGRSAKVQGAATSRARDRPLQDRPHAGSPREETDMGHTMIHHHRTRRRPPPSRFCPAGAATAKTGKVNKPRLRPGSSSPRASRTRAGPVRLSRLPGAVRQGPAPQHHHRHAVEPDERHITARFKNYYNARHRARHGRHDLLRHEPGGHHLHRER